MSSAPSPATGPTASSSPPCDLAKEGAIDGIVTAPLNKAAMHAGGHKYPGHTELLAEQFGVAELLASCCRPVTCTSST